MVWWAREILLQKVFDARAGFCDSCGTTKYERGKNSPKNLVGTIPVNNQGERLRGRKQNKINNQPMKNKTEQRVSHTPGPFEVLDGLSDADVVVVDKYGLTVAKLPTYGGGCGGCCPSQWTAPWHLAAGNARLIAAAPELLDACKCALPWIGKMIADGGSL